MAVHIDDADMDVAVMDGDIPLSEKQMDDLAERVLARLARKERQAKAARESTSIRRSSAPPSRIGK